MSRLPVLSGRQVVRAFEALGCEIARQRGGHVFLVKQGNLATLSVPDHREVAQGTLRGLLRRAGVIPEEFRRAIR